MKTAETDLSLLPEPRAQASLHELVQWLSASLTRPTALARATLPSGV